MNIKQNFIILVACILVLGGCISPWKGEEGTLSVSIGGGGTGRAAFNLDEKSINQLVHTIALSNGPGPQQTKSNLKYGDTVIFSVTPGNWTITITAFLDEQVYATGSWKGYIKPGPNGAIQITMKTTGGKEPDENLKPPIMVTDNGDNSAPAEGTLRWAIAQANEEADHDTIVIASTVSSIALTDSLPYITSDITIIAEGGVTITRTSGFAQAFFFVGMDDGTTPSANALTGTLTLGGNKKSIALGDTNASNALTSLIIICNDSTLVINDGVTLRNNINNSPMAEGNGGVFVDHGTFIMNGGEISGNEFIHSGDGGIGGGVFVDGGTFTMNGGTIKGNSATSWGGGVYVVGSNGTFTMNGGTISQNTADQGGGVYVLQGGTFKIAGGIVYGSDDSANTNNASSGGAALYVGTGGTAQYEKKNNNGGTNWVNIPLDLSSTGAPTNYRDTTIKVENGVLTP